MKRKYLVLTVAIVVMSTLSLAIVVCVNPFNWGIDKSERFSEAKFNAIRNGESIDAVIERLGRPLTVAKNVGAPGACPSDECDKYAFTAWPSKWLISYREAWVFVDRNGRVVHTTMHLEP